MLPLLLLEQDFHVGASTSLDKEYVIWGIGIFCKFPDSSWFIICNLLELYHQILDLRVFLALL